jgi:hypothetical protein
VTLFLAVLTAASAWEGENADLWVDAGPFAHVGGWDSPRRRYGTEGVFPGVEARLGWGAVHTGVRAIAGDGMVVWYSRFGARPIRYGPVGLVFAYDISMWGYYDVYAGVEVDVPRIDQLQLAVMIEVEDGGGFPSAEASLRWRAW